MSEAHARAAILDDGFLSGRSGHVAGVRRRILRRTGDLAFDLRSRIGRTGPALDALGATIPSREVVVLSVYRPPAAHLERAAAGLRASRHHVRLAFGSMDGTSPALADATLATDLSGGKFQNLNAVWQRARAAGEPPDWVLVVDDDVVLPARFLDRFLGLCERFDLSLAQPAQSLRSHAAWQVTRRRAGTLLRETRFVEIGPVTAFRRDAVAELIPFPDLRYGWGLDSHWAAVARDRGWRLGIADALPVRHEGSPIATAYRRDEAIDEARRFLADRPYVPRTMAEETVATHRRIPRPG